MKNYFCKSALIVDDEEDLREVLTLILSDKVETIFEAENGIIGYNLYLEKKPQLIVTDLRMPKLNGMELLNRIRKIDTTTPIILITGHGDQEDLEKALQMGAFDFIEKPFRPERLLSTIERAARASEKS
jgi:DNA-binding NtrC family response regulator